MTPVKVKAKRKRLCLLPLVHHWLPPFLLFLVVLICFLILSPITPSKRFPSYEAANRPLKKATFSPIQNHIQLRKTCGQNSTLKNLLTAKSTTDPAILDYIRCFHLTPPLEHGFYYKRQRKVMLPENAEVSERRRKLKELLEHKENGFFVECYPPMHSHSAPFSFSLEMRPDWEGLVFERDPIKMLMLNELFPKSWISNACLSSSAKKPFLKMKENSRCFSIISFLEALKRRRINLLSLGEGELSPWQIIKPLLSRAEYRIEIIDLAHQAIKPISKTILRNFIKSKGYNLTLETPKHYIFERLPPITPPSNYVGKPSPLLPVSNYSQ